MTTTLAVFLGFLAVTAFWSVGVHNRLIRLRNVIHASHAQMDAQLKRRYAVALRLIEALQAYFSDAPALLQTASAACAQASVGAEALRGAPASASALRALALADSVLQNALASLQTQLDDDTLHQAYIAVDQSLRESRQELAAVDSALEFARKVYNTAALAYNQAIAQFPAVLLAKLTQQRPAAAWQG